MKIFQCGNCGHPLFFESIFCESCNHTVGYNDELVIMNTFEQNPDSELFADRDHKQYRFCKNKEYGVCNWVIAAESNHDYCTACSLNRIIPNLSNKTNHEKWQKLELAKHRLVYQLQRFGFDLQSKMVSDEGLCFDFLAKQEGVNVMTGHADGVITILLSEADSVLREQMRREMSEPYRTLIGHFRHEVGHYFWDRLIANDNEVLENFRSRFGDERRNYKEALKLYYDTGGNQEWSDYFISKYATSHPWEDWAESWAHYLHIMDVTETAFYFGLKVAPVKGFSGMNGHVKLDPYTTKDFNKVIEECIPLLFAANAINRSMGISDVYPFVINQSVINKMTFIHELIVQKVN